MCLRANLRTSYEIRKRFYRLKKFHVIASTMSQFHDGFCYPSISSAASAVLRRYLSSFVFLVSFGCPNYLSAASAVLLFPTVNKQRTGLRLFCFVCCLLFQDERSSDNGRRLLLRIGTAFSGLPPRSASLRTRKGA